MCDESNGDKSYQLEQKTDSKVARVQCTDTSTQTQICLHVGRTLAALGDELNLRYQNPSFARGMVPQLSGGRGCAETRQKISSV